MAISEHLHYKDVMGEDYYIIGFADENFDPLDPGDSIDITVLPVEGANASGEINFTLGEWKEIYLLMGKLDQRIRKAFKLLQDNGYYTETEGD